jgi:hypothetical protein
MAAMAGATILGGATIAQSVTAQPYAVYAAEPGYHYDAYGRPYFEDGYGTPGFVGPVAVPYDRYGPDPNGLIAADGHRIKCKLQDSYSYRFERYVTRRVCD